MKHTLLTIPIVAVMILGGCAAAGAPSGGSGGSGGADGGAGGGGTSGTTHPACGDWQSANPDPSRPWKQVANDVPMPDGFGFVTELGPSCIYSYAADGLTFYSVPYLAATDAEVDALYAGSKQAAEDRGWTATVEDADALGDDFIDGEWTADPDSADAEYLGAQGLVPVGPDYADAVGLEPDQNLMSLEFAVKG